MIFAYADVRKLPVILRGHFTCFGDGSIAAFSDGRALQTRLQSFIFYFCTIFGSSKQSEDQLG